MDANSALPLFPFERSIGWSKRDLMVPLAMVEVLVPNKSVTLSPQHGATSAAVFSKGPMFTKIQTS